jgi:hypothetical protein
MFYDKYEFRLLNAGGMTDSDRKMVQDAVN